MSAGSPMDDIVMFIDVTFEMTACPGDNQRVMYNSYKKGHGYKWQGVTSPDRHLALCHGPVEGHHADGHILDWSGLEELIRNVFHGYGGRQLFVYGDPAYGEMDVIVSGLKKVQDLSPLKQQFNTTMAQLQQSVECSFGKLGNLWAFLNYKPGIQTHLSPVACYFHVTVLLTNAHTSLYGLHISKYFGCKPPTVNEYFHKVQ